MKHGNVKEIIYLIRSHANRSVTGIIAMLIILTGCFLWPLHTAAAASSEEMAASPIASFSPIAPYPVPDKLILTVRETAGVPRTEEVVRSGIPIPRSLNLLDAGVLTLVTGAGTPVPAEFEVLARWNAGKNNPKAPIQWLLVTFQATVPASEARSFRVVTDGSAGENPLPAQPLRLVRKGNQITVDTGAAVFKVGGNPGALFDKALTPSQTELITGGALTATANGVDTSLSSLRGVTVEHAGPLSAVVVVEGAYDMAPVGDGALSAMRRYVFTLGSPTAIVRHVVNWEGDLCGSGVVTCDPDGSGSQQMNGVLMTRVRDALSLGQQGPLSVTALGSSEAAVLQGTAGDGEEAWVRQTLRKKRTASLAFDVQVPGQSGQNGQKADGGMFAVSGTSGTVAIALNHMHRYEPQALRLLADGRLAVDVVDDKAWLAARQGLFATFGVSVLPEEAARATLDRVLWAPLNHPLRAWPTGAWFSASGAMDEIPVGKLPADLAGYDTLTSTVLNDTLQQVDEKGIAGLMTFGLYPRIWGNPIYSDEIDCYGNDPTPGEAWDNPYWCGTWTDYHNTVATAPITAMRKGQVEWLDEIGFPGALRTLHTQIMQCSPEDPYFYCGQAPAGYGGYRSDFNSSHAYFDNLFLYYWLTGDRTVVNTLKRGAESMRGYLCTRRPDSACLPEDPPTDEWAHLTGRVAYQWNLAFRFVGLSSNDASFLQDFRANQARAFTQNYVEAARDGKNYGFLLDGTSPLAQGPGTYSSDQLWMVSLYDMNNLYRLQQDTNDAPIGRPAVRPSQVLEAWARTLTDFGSKVAGNGSPQGQWPNALSFTWSGKRIGGALGDVSANLTGDDPYLYETGKSTLSALLARAAEQSRDASLMQMADKMTHFALNAALNNGAPLGKEKGELLSRLPSAVALLAKPRVSIAATDPTAKEAGPDKGIYTVFRTGKVTKPLTVKYTMDGTATNGLDYRLLSGSVTIPAGAFTARIPIRPVDDSDLGEGTETALLTLSPAANYVIATPGIPAEVRIEDND